MLLESSKQSANHVEHPEGGDNSGGRKKCWWKRLMRILGQKGLWERQMGGRRKEGDEKSLGSNMSTRPQTGSHPVYICILYVCVYLCLNFHCNYQEDTTLGWNLSNQPLPGSHPVCICILYFYVYLYLYLCFQRRRGLDIGIESVKWAAPRFPLCMYLYIVFCMCICVCICIFRRGEDKTLGLNLSNWPLPGSHPVQRSCCPLLVSPNQNFWQFGYHWDSRTKGPAPTISRNAM